jgi:hypothetical protein
LEPDEDIANDVYCPSLMDAVELHGHLEDLSLGWDSCIDDNGDDLEGDEGYVTAMEVLSEGEQPAVALGLESTSTKQGAVHALGPSSDSGEQHTSLRVAQEGEALSRQTSACPLQLAGGVRHPIGEEARPKPAIQRSPLRLEEIVRETLPLLLAPTERPPSRK